MFRWRLRQNVSNHLTSGYMFQNDPSILHSFANERIAYINVIGPSMTHRILCQCNTSLMSLLITMGSWRGFPTSVSNLRSQSASWVTILSATYSASVVDSATRACFLLSQLTAQLAKKKTRFLKGSYGHPYLPPNQHLSNQSGFHPHTSCNSGQDIQFLSHIWESVLLQLSDFVWDLHSISTQPLLGWYPDELWSQHKVGLGFPRWIVTRSYRLVC